MPPAPSQFTSLISNITAGMPYLRSGKPADMFAALRRKIIKDAGFNFLTTFGDMMRARNYMTNQAGVSNTSRHKCGDAFDYNQGDPRLTVVQEPRGDRMYFRTYLRCMRQDGSQGELLSLSGGPAKHYCDFTSIAEALGWHRIRAQSGWQNTWKKREFWHYQLTEGYSFDQGMELLYGNRDSVAAATEYPTVALNDRDDEDLYHGPRHVRQVQAQLHVLRLLQPVSEVDGAFGQKTENAVKAFQEPRGLPVTGRADTETRRALLQQVLQ